MQYTGLLSNAFNSDLTLNTRRKKGRGYRPSTYRGREWPRRLSDL